MKAEEEAKLNRLSAKKKKLVETILVHAEAVKNINIATEEHKRFL
jgi:hypothetical protein